VTDNLPGEPEMPSLPREPQSVALGRALAARLAEATRMTATASAAAGMPELASHRFAKRVRHVHNLETRGIAKELITGHANSEKESAFIGKLGVMAALHGLPVATLTRSYFLWRDANLEVLDEEAGRLGTEAAIADAARTMIRSSADVGIVRVARAYDSQRHMVGHREDGVTSALRDSEARLHAAFVAASKKNAELSAAMAEISEKNQQLKGVNRQQSDFVANVSHELRTPLASILGYAEILLGGMSGNLDTEQRQDVLEVQAGGKMLLALVNDIVDVSQLEAGKMRLNIGCVSLVAAIESVTASLRMLADSKGLYLRTEIARSAYAAADEMRLKQVLNNLIGNAIKFTDAGGVTINCLPWAGYWRVSVADTGIGLSVDGRSKVFERFVQLDAGLTRRFGGVGLGLTIAKGLVNMQGGEIGVDSTPGRGSTFWFTMPAFNKTLRAQTSAPPV
jgi:signal transduction histidine kinase